MPYKHKEFMETPTASINIITNGTYDVIEKATAVVSFPIYDESYKSYFSITTSLTNVTASASNPTEIEEGGSASLTFTATGEYVLPDNITVVGATYTWTQSTGSLQLSNADKNIYINITGLPDYLCFTAKTANSTIAMSITGTPTLGQNFSTSTDRTNWTTFTPGTTTITLTTIGDKVYFKGDNPNGVNESSSMYHYFTMTGGIDASGNIMSLVDNGNCNTLVIPNEHCFNSLFENCTSLASAPRLPATTLAKACYRYTFSGCLALISAPELPAVTLAEECYYAMFKSCESLTSAPELSAYTLNDRCYYMMFKNCKSLRIAPSLPAMTLATSCYGEMFYNCILLTVPPALNATVLANYCYAAMFYGCSSLSTAPILSATTLTDGCYGNMFGYCTSLTTPPALPATTLTSSCYNGMFTNCTNLSTPPVLSAMTLATMCYKQMFVSCTSLSTAPALPATVLAESCYSEMFYKCTSITTAPTLPATTLAKECYSGMFWDCTSLVTVPALPATTLANSCYIIMFDGCTALQVSDSSTTSATQAWRLPTSGTFTNTFEQTNMFFGCLGTRSARGSAVSGDDMPGALGQSYTYYTQNAPV